MALENERKKKEKRMRRRSHDDDGLRDTCRHALVRENDASIHVQLV